MPDSSFDYTEPEPGNYPAQFSSIEDFEYDDKITHAKELRWKWLFHGDDGYEFDTLTARTWKPGTIPGKFLAGILGRPAVKGDNITAHLGKRVRITYGPNKAGRLTITDVQVDRAAAPVVFTPAPAPTALPGESIAAAQPSGFAGVPPTEAIEALPSNLPFD